MMRFLDTKSGKWVSSNEITEIAELSGDNCQVITANGKRHVIEDHVAMTIAEIEYGEAVPFSSNEGFHIAFAMPPRKKGEAWKLKMRPVVGWAAGRSSAQIRPLMNAIPIAVCTEPYATWVLVGPDNKVAWDNEEGFEGFPVDAWFERTKSAAENDNGDGDLKSHDS